MMHRKKLGRAVLCAATVLALATPAYAQRRGQPEIPPPRLNPQFLAAFRKSTAEASKSTVRVLCEDKEAALGTILSADGWIVTKYTLLSGKPIVCKTKNGQLLSAKVMGIHEAFDLALLKVEATNLPAVKLVESKVAPVGNWLVSVGPSDEPVAVGVMSVAARTPPPPAQRGGRGGAKAGPRGGDGRGGGGGGRGGDGRGGGRGGPPPSTDYLGIRVVQDGTAAKIDRVTAMSPGARAGLQVDDKILSIQGKAVTTQDSLLELLGTLRVGDEVTIKLVRDGKEMELKARLQQMGQRGRADQNQMGSELSEKRTGFPTYFQTDTVIKPKDCGGPVCDLDGRVIGINIARAGRVESYAVPTEALTPLLPDLMSGKLSPQIVLGKKIADLTAALVKAEEDKAAVEKKFKEAQDTLTRQQADKAAAEQKVKETKEALEKLEKELKDKT